MSHYHCPNSIPIPSPRHANTGLAPSARSTQSKAHEDVTSARYVTTKLGITHEKSPLTLSSLVPMLGYEAIYRWWMISQGLVSHSQAQPRAQPIDMCSRPNPRVNWTRLACTLKPHPWSQLTPCQEYWLDHRLSQCCYVTSLRGVQKALHISSLCTHGF